MPILEVEIVTGSRSQELPAGLSQALADAAAQVFAAPPGSTWVRLRQLPGDQYAEDGGAPEEVFPVFVSVLKARLPDSRSLAAEAASLTAAVARILDRPEANVHVLYQPEGNGRVAFGGRLVG